MYLSDVVLDYLQLDAITKFNIFIKFFRNTKGQFNELAEFTFGLRGFRKLKFAVGGLYKSKMVLLIGAKIYWGAVYQSARRGNEVGPVAVVSKFE